jgi:hypothetical protein
MLPPDAARRRSADRLALGLLAAGLAWRVALAVLVAPAWERAAGVGATPDAYPLLAETLVERGTLGYGDAGATPTTVRGPGFPLWLAPAVLAFGTDPRWMGVWGALPGILAGALVAWLAATRHGPLAGWIAGAVAILHPLPSIVAARAMGDDFYAALAAAGAIAWWWALLPGASWAGADTRWRDAVPARVAEGPSALSRDAIRAPAVFLAGALLAGAILTRSTGVLALAACAAYGLARGRRGATALLVGVALVPALAWSARTSRLEGRPVFVHSLVFYNFWIGEGLDRHGPGPAPAGSWSRIVRETWERAGVESPGAPRWYGTLAPREAAAVERALAREASARVLGDPAGYALRVARGIGRFFFQASTVERSRQYLAAVAPVLLLAILGAAGVARRRSGDGLGRLLLAILALHALAYAAILPAARMSVQIYPELAYLAGAGGAFVLHGFRGGKPKTLGTHPPEASS